MRFSNKVTAKAIAERTGYSVSAVSRAFRPGSPISEAKRAEILAVAKELNYSGPQARFSDGFGHRTVAVVMGEMSNPFYPAAVELLSSLLHEKGIRMIFHAIPRERDVDAVMEQVLDYRVDGAIIASAVLTSRLARACRAARMPVVHFNRVQADPHSTAVCCDNHGGAQEIAGYLLDKGHQRFGFIGGRRDTSTHLERRRGFLDGLQGAGRDLSAEAEGNFHYVSALRAAEDLLDARPRIDALFCCNDIMALAAIDVAKRRGLGLPEDLAIVGFDDIPMAGWAPYDLTTMRQPVRRMLCEAIAMIFDGEEHEGHIRIHSPELRVRSSG